MNTGYIFGVQKYGTTIEWESKISVAESAFNQASPGGVVLYKIDRSTAKKTVLKTR
jgi:hypothetical protein